MSLYDKVRANVDSGATEERVEVNQRALIDKILARYASAGAVYRELLQNSNDAEATVAEIYFTTAPDTTSASMLQKTVVTSVQYRNNGLPFRPQDWARLKKIAEGNPDESKIGAFGVGAYTMFSICEEPIVLSGNQALAFVWKGDALWTKTVDNDNGKGHEGWTSFVLPSRDLYPLPDLEEFGEFLCASLTFTKCLRDIRVFVDDKPRMTITKTLLQEPSVVQIQKNSSWWKSDGAVTTSPNGLFSLRDENALQESFYHVQVSLDGDTAAVTARYLSAVAKTKIPANMTSRMERVTKKKPPSKVEVQIFLNGQQHIDDSVTHSGNRRNKAHKIVQSFSPRIGEGRIFIGFRTSQTTGLAAHLAAPFVPTVEREAMDLQDQTLRLFNLELLEFSGILMRLTLEHGMSAIGVEFAKGAAERAQLEARLLKEAEEKAKVPVNSTATSENDDDDTITTADQTVSTETEDTTSKSSRVWGFAKYMAKGVKKTIVKVVNKVEEFVDDGAELIHPRDPRPLCSEEHQAIILMQSFCPRQSTPDPLVGTALAQGFSRCLPEKAPPVLTRTGVVSGDEARLPCKGMEAFCKENVVRSIVYNNAEEYHNVIAQCQALNLDDLSKKIAQDVFDEDQLIRFIKWWVKFSRIHPHISTTRSLDIKDRIQFFLQYRDDKETVPVFKLRDFLFYLDKDKIRTGSGFSIETLPMPDSVIPKGIQDSVTLRTLTDSSLRAWFEPLPIEIWIEFISHHQCMNSGQPEDEKLRLQVLSALSQEYSRRPSHEQSIFGSFCHSVLQNRRCIPFDSSIPTAFSADCPSNLYLYSAELEAFDSIGNFHKVSQSLKHLGITDEFLLALGVRKSVAIDFLFSNLDTLKWSSDPKPLIEYLRTASLTPKDIAKLETTQYLPCENDVSRMFAPNELYLPDRDLRIFPFLRLLQWPSQDEITERSQNGRFLVRLGMKVLPPLIEILRFASNEVSDNKMRIQCLEYVSKRLGSNGVYQQDYARIGKGERIKLTFLPCVKSSPFDGEKKAGLYSVLTCCSEERCSVMGFPVIDPSLGNTGKVLANVFQCVKEPDPGALIQQLLLLVSSAKQLLAAKQADRKGLANNILKAFSDIFQYLSSRTADIQGPMMRQLESNEFIPSLVNNEIEWFRPQAVFFKSGNDNGDSVTESLFHVVDFSPFLAAAGVKQDASTKDIFRLMIESPKSVLMALKTEDRYRMFLRRVAAHRPFQSVTPEIRNSPFLLAYSGSGDSSNEKNHYELAVAKDIYIIDNSFFGRMFPVKRAPPESDLEEFYALIGSKYISKEVDKKFDVIGARQRKTELTAALLERINERCPLLVSPSVTSRPLVANAASILDDKHLEVYEVSEVKAVYSLGKSVRTHQTTCCCQPAASKRNYLYITADFDWFDVGCAIGELILQRCQLEDAFFISSLLEAPLEQLRARGFPVDRIIKAEPVPEPEPPIPPASIQPSSDASSSTRSQTAADTSSKESASAVASGLASQSGNASGQQDQGHSGDTGRDPKSSISQDDYVQVLKQMFPAADEDFLRKRLGHNPSMEQVRQLAEEMAMGQSTETSQTTKTNKSAMDESSGHHKPNKVLGSRKLGRAFDGIRGSTFGGVGGVGGHGGRTRHETDTTSAPSTTRNDNIPVSPEVDVHGHSNMMKLLENTVRTSRNVDPNGVQSSEVNLAIPEGLDKGPTCEVIPGHDLQPFVGLNERGETHNGIKVFSARKHPSSHDFLRGHVDALESFAVVVERLCGVFGLSLSTVAIFHDPTGGVIAFNQNRALHFNLRFFHSLHYSRDLHNSRECYSYWFVTFCHELAHHMASGHNREHGFYTESYISLYLPKVIALLSKLDR